ncbi:hypothetical protein ASPTUDRAFT_730342 [Aspergillus tubingensis CBS 134.48]|uniref:Uncharacterized protein n=1 Tax=Aspergillus tubingensis (strain CBS 134.48) TaxID=767770 RepID=A0A1L9MXV1_ASPTC|nr:hypothetical protein ASPTUDRAFT_730342 [Aspergillus tubingensis CBS 134.48]
MKMDSGWLFHRCPARLPSLTLPFRPFSSQQKMTKTQLAFNLLLFRERSYFRFSRFFFVSNPGTTCAAHRLPHLRTSNQNIKGPPFPVSLVPFASPRSYLSSTLAVTSSLLFYSLELRLFVSWFHHSAFSIHCAPSGSWGLCRGALAHSALFPSSIVFPPHHQSSYDLSPPTCYLLHTYTKSISGIQRIYLSIQTFLDIILGILPLLSESPQPIGIR